MLIINETANRHINSPVRRYYCSGRGGKMPMAEKLVTLRKKGDASPSIDNLKCLSILYKVSIDYLVNDNEEDFREDHNV